MYTADDKRFVQLMEIEFKNLDEFIQDYSTNTVSYIAAAAGATGGVVSTSKMERVKGCWDPAYLILNFWSSPENFETAYSSGAIFLRKC